MKFLKDFIILLKARYPIIYISTSEEERIEYLLKYSSKKYISRVCYVWNFVEGYQGNPNNKGLATKNPLEALEFIEKLTPVPLWPKTNPAPILELAKALQSIKK